MRSQLQGVFSFGIPNLLGDWRLCTDVRSRKMDKLLRADIAMISEYGQETDQANHDLGVIAAQKN